MKNRFAKSLAVAIGTLAMSGCFFFKPRIVTAYDDECEIGFRKMVLTAEQLPLLQGSCSGAECGAAVVVGVLGTSITAIVSGSIVLVGNTVFWMEKRGRCDVQEARPASVAAETT